jgi:hypothetical protein
VVEVNSQTGGSPTAPIWFLNPVSRWSGAPVRSVFGTGRLRPITLTPTPSTFR